MKIIVISVVVVAVLLIISAILFILFKRPDISKYEYLKNPLISKKTDVKVLEVKFEVDSNGLQKVFGLLFRTYFGLKGVPKGSKMEPPAARYENAIDFNMEKGKRDEAFKNISWKGSAAIPIPENVNILPKSNSKDGLIAEFNTWKYGDTAEILHFGAYEDEPATVKKLTDYINKNGYEISGAHEEVYIIGPGIPFTKPDKYVTIIRYPVKKK